MSKNEGYLPLPKGSATITIHEAQDPEKWTHNEIVTPITMSTVFKQVAPGELRQFKPDQRHLVEGYSKVGVRQTCRLLWFWIRSHKYCPRIDRKWRSLNLH